MQPLILRSQLLRGRSELSYTDLAQRLAQERAFLTMHARNRRLYVALGEVVDRCRKRSLPAIPAIVWRRDLRRPGASYYPRARPRARTSTRQIAAWRAEHGAVLARRRYRAVI